VDELCAASDVGCELSHHDATEIVGRLEPLQKCVIVYSVKRCRQVQDTQQGRVTRIENQKDVSSDLQHGCVG